MKKKEFLTSLLIFIPLGAILSSINYKFDVHKVLIKAIIFGYTGALSVFIVPFIFNRFNKKNN